MNRPESDMGKKPSPGYALLSVYDKTGLVEFARVLADAGYRLVSTGGTFAELQAAGLEVRQVSQVTGSPEILDGRVKTLHPAIHGGLLARRSEGGHLEQIAEQGITPVDVVVNNLYPFTDTVSVKGATLDDALENIDIGGPAMTRAAAKNFPDVIVVVDPADYERIGGMIASGGVPHAERRRLAAKAFQHVALYDTAISAYLRQDGQAEPEMPAELTVGLSLADIPRYGENPHQAGGVYSLPGESGGVANAGQLHGIGMSYLNYFDADSAWRIASGFPRHAVAIVKHANPCGLAVHEQQDEAYRRALAGDPVSAYGGIVGFNSVVTMPTVRAMRGVLFDVIVAPDYEPDAASTLKRRKRTRVLRVDAASHPQIEVRTISGGALVQTPDASADDPANWHVVSARRPTSREQADLEFAWQACRYVRSNAIVIAKDRSIAGMGAGQPNRVNSVEIAARAAGDQAVGAALASDAFFPFPDGVERAAEAGVTAIVQPGGSIRDDETTAAADRLGLAMAHTGVRHFLH